MWRQGEKVERLARTQIAVSELPEKTEVEAEMRVRCRKVKGAITGDDLVAFYVLLPFGRIDVLQDMKLKVLPVGRCPAFQVSMSLRCGGP